MIPSRAQHFIAGAMLVLAACNDDGTGTPPPVTAMVNAWAGATQDGTVGQPVATLPAVRITDVRGRPVPNVGVNFAIGSGSGQLTGGYAATNANGVAAVGSWILGARAGAQTLQARVTIDGASATTVFETVALAGAPARIERPFVVRPPVRVGEVVSPAPTIRVLDQYGNRVDGVQFAVARTGASSPGTSMQLTQSDGSLTVTDWTADTVPGTASLTLSLNGSFSALGPVVFASTVLPGPPATMLVLAGDEQRGDAGVALPVNPRLRFLDRFGNPATGFMVSWRFGVRLNGVITFRGLPGGQPLDPQGEIDLGPWVPALGANVITGDVSTGQFSRLTFQLTATGLGPPSVQAVEHTSGVAFMSDQNGSMNPAVDTVRVGQTVEWSSSDISDDHQVAWVGEVFPPSSVFGYGPPGYRVTFAAAGTYSYFDPTSPQMTGRIVVR